MEYHWCLCRRFTQYAFSTLSGRTICTSIRSSDITERRSGITSGAFATVSKVFKRWSFSVRSWNYYIVFSSSTPRSLPAICPFPQLGARLPADAFLVRPILLRGKVYVALVRDQLEGTKSHITQCMVRPGGRAWYRTSNTSCGDRSAWDGGKLLLNCKTIGTALLIMPKDPPPSGSKIPLWYTTRARWFLPSDWSRAHYPDRCRQIQCHVGSWSSERTVSRRMWGLSYLVCAWRPLFRHFE